MKRGSVYWVNFEPSNPPEFGKVRPAIIISNSEYNYSLNTVVVVPLSTQAGEIWPLRLELKLEKNKSSFAVIPGVRQIAKERLHEIISNAPLWFMEKLDEALALYLSEI